MSDPVLVAKIAGAVIVFALGIWIGLGMPGVKHRQETKDWRSADRFRATWINRVFFKMDNAPRRFDASRLIVPKHDAEDKPAGSSEDEAESNGIVRPSRRGRDGT